MRRLIACVFTRFAPMQLGVALYVADRESSYYPWAHNPSGCEGIYQHMSRYWAERARTYLWRGWFAPWSWPVSVYDPRASVIVTARMVAAGGWGPWVTAP